MQTGLHNSQTTTLNPMIKVWSCFSGTGKTRAHDQALGYDCDSSRFHWDEKGVVNPAWPNNYIEAIKSLSGFMLASIFVSSHEIVREGLKNQNIPFVLVYPAIHLKEEYRERYIKRGDSPSFINTLMNNWNPWINDLTQVKCERHIVLRENQFISDVL
jgi:hypothetical protein